ncbi:DUF397 domain-containing protein [Glycomyces buryatensis]|uniref:DUF397 domain-containing protein n=1 Tax=Glycomyces buryatensis TaxID=2570927 RepID=A0A4S8QJC1_9ACTN|nr:DUF397 domain-containing protein [Glycomyces buryatensis]
MPHGAYDRDRWARARFRKSSRSNGGSNGNCVAFAVLGDEVAVGDTKTPVADSYAHLRVRAADLGGLLAGIKSGALPTARGSAPSLFTPAERVIGLQASATEEREGRPRDTPDRRVRAC